MATTVAMIAVTAMSCQFSLLLDPAGRALNRRDDGLRHVSRRPGLVISCRDGRRRRRVKLKGGEMFGCTLR